MKPLSRRTLLTGGGAAIALPFLNAMGDPRRLMQGVPSAYAQASGFPKRLLICISSNGTIKGQMVAEDMWTPDASFNFPYILEPLTPNKDKLVVLDGVSCQACSDSQGNLGANPHDASVTQLTGRRFIAGTHYQDAGGGTLQGAYITPTGPSVDQEIGDRLVAGGTTTKFKTYQMFTYPNPEPPLKDFGIIDSSLYYQWAGQEQGILGERDPVKSFTDLFSGGTGGGPMTGGDMTRLIAQKKSILDAALDSYNTLRAKVGADDKALLDKHMDGIRAIETQLESGMMMPTTNGCTEPMQPTSSFGTQDTYPEHLAAQNDLMVAALACDLTRVGVLEWEPGLSELVHTHLGQTRNHHDISHDTSQEAHQQLADINNWYAKQLNDLLDKMKAVPEGDGTLLDNTMVVWLLELSEGSTHDHNNQAIVIAGGCGGQYTTGRYLKAAVQINALHVSMLNLMGFSDVNQFGDTEYGSGPLPGLIV